MNTPLPDDYAERVYAGVLGKVIGVYLGRPFEGWSYELIQEHLGDIEYYVHDKLNVPLIVTDDDISGTFTFLRALADNDFDPGLSARQIGEAWLNYLIEKRTILWWGGLGNSTEHTAYLRLKHGVPAPESGSMARNGKVVSEQIGAQIFIDGWAMVSPGDPGRAATLAEQAARVSHDGEAVYGAVVMAVLEAMAFVESDTNRLLDTALSYVPADSVIRQLIDDVRGWHAKEPDWRATREMLAARYGYDKYGGNCHMVPNHGLIIHSLLHGEDDFSQTMKIINTCGWDTDCNSGNVGCLMGIKNGIQGIDQALETGVDWRGPVADRIYIPTADPTWGISDCAREAVEIVNAGRALAEMESWQPKNGAQFHFEFPGSVQGFTVTSGNGEIENVEGHSATGRRCLRLRGDGAVRFGTPVFTPSKDTAKYFETRGYTLMASPRVYPGHTLSARVSGKGRACLYAAWYGENDEVTISRGTITEVAQGRAETVLHVPPEAHPVFEVGLELEDSGLVYLDSLGWSGEPDAVFEQPDHRGTMWRRAWVNGVDDFWSRGEAFRLMHNEGRGLLIQGTRQWCDYSVEADITPHLAESAGIAVRVQGMRRYYALLLGRDQQLRLVRMLNEETLLASCPLDWELGETHRLTLSVKGNRITASIDGEPRLEAADGQLQSGALALVIEEGRTATRSVRVSPCSE
ncbi:MAG: ADP-ribosylglycohydrolase family protein [Pseudomonadales bacterium]|nr:ADP-ribosylglycohydrolase family protein [Pseudomonadales bacterium]MDP6469600.1 ADP-ribosylglycohydrolase family protein [Pseudomonadales bacterium]MDP6827441.1 ADP-ribosylglycohydrolase family protein [Pseudomonadales bacterium]MDP6972197.1 ADP-ribosylglycohydrolase family protein [Pseudomonadales bacterium]